VIIDIGMPGINGYALAGRLRQQANHSAVLVALTGWSQERDRQRAMAAGFDYFFIKPVELDDLLQIIDASDCSARAQIDLSRRVKALRGE
jgi:CheY-like chemotaxis protein